MIADRHTEDPELPDAEWDGDDIVITQFASDGSSSRTRVAPDGAGRYAICPHWPWAVSASPAPTVFDDLLSYATRFTFDGNTVAPGKPGWDPRLVVHVEQAGTDEWCVTRDALVLNLVEYTWESERAARTSDGAARLTYHVGRNAAIGHAQNILHRALPGSVPDR